jgi:hypothetical protein
MKKSDIRKEIWERAKQEMKLAIIERAKQRGMIAYSELLNKVTALQLELEHPDHRSIMAEMLGEISLAEDKAGRGMLSALVVHKTGDMEPGQGFFYYAEVLGRDISDKVTCWVQEIHKVHDCWANV